MQVIFNDEVVSPGFQKDGIFIFTLGINMVAKIPKLGVTVTFSGLIFSIQLPYSKFGGNTEGQCGKNNVLIPVKQMLFHNHVFNLWNHFVITMRADTDV